MYELKYFSTKKRSPNLRLKRQVLIMYVLHVYCLNCEMSSCQNHQLLTKITDNRA